MIKGSLTINIIANSIAGPMSGGDRIWIECAKRWIKKGIIVNVFTTEEGYDRALKYGLNELNFTIWSSTKFNKFGLYVLYAVRIIKGALGTMQVSSETKNAIIFSSSDFWPDLIPGFLMNRNMKDSKWIAAFYLFAPNPLSKESPYRGRRFFRGLIYYISQILSLWLIRRYAHMVFVTSEPDRKKFISDSLTADRVIAVRGGVDIESSELVLEPEKKEYDAVFIGRFHPQKGVLELIDIWRYVCEEKKNAKMVMIGVGELEKSVKEKIEKYTLDKNVQLLGFKDGIEKIKIFKSSKVVLHPAIYDSGGMAACEAMACGLPGVSFDLSALETYYPKGMIKTPIGDLKAFAKNIVKLLENKELYKKTQEDAVTLAREEWDWDERAADILQQITVHLAEV